VYPYSLRLDFGYEVWGLRCIHTHIGWISGTRMGSVVYPYSHRLDFGYEDGVCGVSGADFLYQLEKETRLSPSTNPRVTLGHSI